MSPRQPTDDSILARLDAEREANAIICAQAELARKHQTVTEGSLEYRLRRVILQDTRLSPAVRAVLERHVKLMDAATAADDRMQRERARPSYAGGVLHF